MNPYSVKSRTKTITIKTHEYQQRDANFGSHQKIKDEREGWWLYKYVDTISLLEFTGHGENGIISAKKCCYLALIAVATCHSIESRARQECMVTLLK